MLSLSRHSVLDRIAKRAEMRKEISGVMKNVKTIEPEQSWSEYRPVDKIRCKIKTASVRPESAIAALMRGCDILSGRIKCAASDRQEPPGLLDRLKTRMFLALAKYRLRHGDYDVLTDTGLHRVKIPAWRLEESAIPMYGFDKSLIAVPERGQTSMVTYRAPEGHYHIHRHKNNWFMHKDKFQSVNMAIDKIRKDKGLGPYFKARELGKGLMHVMGEGIPGMYSYLVNAATGAPTFEDLASGKFSQEMVPATMAAPGVKKAVVLEVARTDRERSRGLSGRRTIPDDYGMLFTKAGSFWMRGVPFHLDLLYIDKSGEVVDVQAMRPLAPGEYPELYSDRSGRASMAAELPGGWCGRNGVGPGARLELGGGHGR